MKRLLILMITAAIFNIAALSQATAKVDRKAAAENVKAEFLHAWNGYKKYAWGNDDLKPLRKSHHNWYAEPLLMSPVDGLDTMYIMALKQEAEATREYIKKTHKFHKELGKTTGSQHLRKSADECGTRLLPAFE